MKSADGLEALPVAVCCDSLVLKQGFKHVARRSHGPPVCLVWRCSECGPDGSVLKSQFKMLIVTSSEALKGLLPLDGNIQHKSANNSNEISFKYVIFTFYIPRVSIDNLK
jgi:hypothetical protein